MDSADQSRRVRKSPRPCASPWWEWRLRKGLEALLHIFENAPSQMDMAFVVIVHLAAAHVSHVHEILQRVTTCPLGRRRRWRRLRRTLSPTAGRLLHHSDGELSSALPHIFDMYRQSSRNLTAGWLGIGLALVKQLTELHGRRINVALSLNPLI